MTRFFFAVSRPKRWLSLWASRFGTPKQNSSKSKNEMRVGRGEDERGSQVTFRFIKI